MSAKIPFILFALFLSVQASATPPAAEGKVLFTSRCAGCHNVNKMLAGPALAGVDQRRDMDWIIRFVQSSQTVIKSGDKDAVALFEQFNRIPMPDHKDLSAENVKSIVEYIKTEAQPAGSAKAPFARLEKLHPAYTPNAYNNPGFFISFLGGVALLIGGLLFWVRVKEIERKSV
jgi:mono/diheme cytochrome c family protein